MIVENLIKNGGFESGKDPWTGGKVNEIVDGGTDSTKCVKCTYTTTNWDYITSSYFTAIMSHMYYMGVHVKGNNTTCAYNLFFYSPADGGYYVTGNTAGSGPTPLDWQRVGYIATVTQMPGNTMAALLYANTNKGFTSENYVMYDNVAVVDLTDLFGAGNEPSLAWCNEHIHYSDDGVVVDYEYPSSDGPRSMSNVPIVPWIQPVTDRVAADAVYGNSKGSLDSATLNRIEQNLTYLQQALGIAGMPAGKIPGNLLTREVLEARSDLVVTDVTVDGYTCMELGAKYYYTEATPLDMYIDTHKLYLLEVCMRAKNDGAWATGIMLNTKDGRVWPCETKSVNWQTVTFITRAPLTTAPVVFSSSGLAYPTYYRYLCMYELNSQWRRNDYYLVGKFNQLKHDIMQIRASGLFYADTPELTDSAASSLLGYQEMNNIERVLYDAKQLLDGMKAVQRKLGTFNAGSNYQRQYIRSV